MYLILLVLFLLQFSSNSASKLGQQTNLILTIYRDNYTVVKDVRNIKFSKGYTDLQYTGIPTLTHTDSILFKPLERLKGIVVHQQNVNLQNFSQKQLINQYVNKNITMRNVNKLYNNVSKLLLGYDGFNFFFKNGYGVQVYRGDDNFVIQKQGIQKLLPFTPYVHWRVFSPDDYQTDYQIIYKTDGVLWDTKYDLLLNEDQTKMSMDVQVVIINKSGKDFLNAKLKLFQPDIDIATESTKQITFINQDTSTLFQRSKVSQNTVYSSKQLLNLPNSAIKTMQLFQPINNIPITTFYEIQITAGDESNKQYKVMKLFQFKNTKQSGLGISLPKGIYQFLKQDSIDQTLQFISRKNSIQHILVDQQVKLTATSTYDVKAQYFSSQKKVYRSGRYEANMSLILTNNKSKKISLKLLMKNPYQNNLKITNPNKMLENMKVQNSKLYSWSLELAEKQKLELTWGEQYNP